MFLGEVFALAHGQEDAVFCFCAGGVRDGGAAAPFVEDEEWNPWEDEQVEYNSALHKKREAFKQHLDRIDKNKPRRYKVQIWGKAAIGESWCSLTLMAGEKSTEILMGKNIYLCSENDSKLSWGWFKKKKTLHNSDLI